MKKFLGFVLSVAVLVGLAIVGHYVYKGIANRMSAAVEYVEIVEEL